MKIIFYGLVIFVIISSSAGHVNLTNFMKNDGRQLWKSLQEGEIMTATVNDYADKIMGNMQQLILRKKLDPLALPDVKEKISRKVLFVTYWGSLDLSDIQMKKISTVRRKDDATVTYDISTKQMTLVIPLEFKEIEINCHYKAKLMGLGPSGRITGGMKHLRMKTSIVMDFNEWQAEIGEYKITHSGHIAVHFHEFILVNWMIDILANTVTAIFKRLILDVMEDVIEGILESIVNVINSVATDVTTYFDGNNTVSLDKLWNNANTYKSIFRINF